MTRPQPEPAYLVCSECGLDWGRHQEPRRRECIRLLREDLAARSRVTYTVSDSTIVSPTAWNPKEETA